jgi:hypothetical protein
MPSPPASTVSAGDPIVDACRSDALSRIGRAVIEASPYVVAMLMVGIFALFV